MRNRLPTDILALTLLAATVFVGLSLATYDPADPPLARVWPENSQVHNAAGPAGAFVAASLLQTLGVSAYALLVAMMIVDARLFVRRFYDDLLLRMFGLGLLLSTLAVSARILWSGAWHGPVIGVGGLLGTWGHLFLTDNFHPAGMGLLLGCAFISGMLLTTDYLLFHTLIGVVLFPFHVVNGLGFGRRGGDPMAVGGEATVATARGDLRDEIPVMAPPRSAVPSASSPAAALQKVASGVIQAVRSAPAVANELLAQAAAGYAPIRAAVSAPSGVTSVASVSAGADDVESRSFDLPPLELLEEAEEFPYEYLAEKARTAAQTLEKTFQEFGLNVKVVEIDTGPVITQFELALEAGLRLSKVTALADDLAIALRVPSVRVVAPIPGKNTVGVEVPNDRRVMVRLKEIVEACAAERDKQRIPLFLGKDVSGKPLVVDMAKLPHLLIAGRTGTGKSVCLNTLILSILMSRSPEDVKLLMIDPKMVELSPYMRVPHLMSPVITDMKKAEAVLGWAVDKMEERYDLLARCGVRHLDSYNQLSRDEKLRRLGITPESEEAEALPDRMPYIVIIADEFADLIMTSGKDVEGHIIRLAQKSRAVGIHLVLATQKPTVDVITGLIKSNLPARISFQVASRMDSRVVLDEMGAEKLLGNGDMLYLAPGTSNISRAQGTYVSDEEVMRIIDFFKDQPPQYSKELTQLKPASSSSKDGGKTGIDAIRAKDDLYEQAIEIVIREGRGSTSLLQRAMGIGYGRAARLIDFMAEDGIVGEYNGSQAREVLFTMEEWRSMKYGDELEEIDA